jgi:hypothetical protein
MRSQIWQSSAHPTGGRYDGCGGWVKTAAALLLLRLLCWCPPAIAETLPCLESSPECLNQLTEAAIAHNSEIDSIDDRLELAARQIDRQYERRWTAIIPAIGDLLELNPFNLIETLFGGGSFREVDLRIAELELRLSDLIRRRAEVTVQLHTGVIDLVLSVERGDRQLALLQSQLLSQQQRVAVMEAGYRTGSGDTAQMISLWQQTENIEAQLTETTVSREQSIRKLLETTGYEASNELAPTGGDRLRSGDDETLEVSQPGSGDATGFGSQ